MSSKAKRVLPTRPEPPSAEQILADVRGTHPGDPVFLLPAEPPPDHGPSSGSAGAPEQRQQLYGQSRSYLQRNRQLQESRARLRERREELQRAGLALELGIAQMRRAAC